MKIQSKTMEDPTWAGFYLGLVSFPLARMMPKNQDVWTVGRAKIRETYEKYHEVYLDSYTLRPDGKIIRTPRCLHLYLAHLIGTHGVHKWSYNGLEFEVIDAKPIIVIRRVKKK